MHLQGLQRRLSSQGAKGRPIYRRLPQGNDKTPDDGDDSDSGENMLPPGPITITVTRVVESGTTATIQPSSSPSQAPSNSGYGSSASSTMSASTTTSRSQTYSTTTFSTTQSTQPLPSPSTSSVSATAGGNGSGESNQGLEPVSGSSAPKKLHSGVLIGVIIACIFVAFAIAVFAIRKRYIRRRLQLRKGWARSKGSRLSVVLEPKISFAPNPETMPLAPPPSYGNDPVSPASSTAAASQSPVYGPGSMKTLNQPITTVVSTFITTLPDELSIAVGESIRVLAEYDDGWALCLNTRGEQGMIPMECLDGRYSVISESTSGNRGVGGNLRRVSSLQPAAAAPVIGRF
ncbi:hypothetical protein NMY22_g1314 [Coprinellus aureogranulatus]|nr:hypothetical protein NMY22_g1314 [Coprinellus aureogranulatus]